MKIWVEQAELALINAGVVLLITLIPILVVQSRRLGRLSLPRILGAVAVAAYVAALFTYTWLPLPRPENLSCDVQPRWNPLGFIDDLQLAAERGLTSGGRTLLLQTSLNVVLFLPWGILWRRFLHRGIIGATLSGLAASVFIEAAQLTGLFGIYPCAYRAFDAADIVLNTFGALLGALIAPMVLWWMPQARVMRLERLEPRPVTLTRRWLGMLVDLLGFAVFSYVLNFVGLVVGMLIIQGTTEEQPTLQTSTPLAVISLVCSLGIPWLVWIVIPALGRSGGSPGQTAMWLEPRWGSHAGSWWQRLLRAHVVPGPALVLLVVQHWVNVTPWSFVVAGVMIAASFLLAPFTTTHRAVSGLVTRCTFADLRDGVTRPAEDAA